MKIGRLITAMITPFNDQGDVDFIKSRKLASALIESGSDGLLVGGTTGESPALSDDEKLRLFSEIKSEVGDNVSVIAGTTDNNHKKSLELSLEAEKIGVDALLLTVPSYNKPTQEGLYRHFKSIAEAVSIPGILYNVPSRTSLNMDLGTTLRLAEIDNIIGIKEASSDQFQITQIIDSSPDDFLVWSGNDDEAFQVMSVGGYGIVSVASNIIGLQIKDMITLILSGKFSDAAMQHRKLLPLFKALFWVTNPIPVKYALNISGFPVGGVRLPLYEPDTDFVNKFDNIISDFEIDIKYHS